MMKILSFLPSRLDAGTTNLHLATDFVYIEGDACNVEIITVVKQYLNLFHYTHVYDSDGIVEDRLLLSGAL
jgi:hypothetical protein